MEKAQQANENGILCKNIIKFLFSILNLLQSCAYESFFKDNSIKTIFKNFFYKNRIITNSNNSSWDGEQWKDR